MVKTRAKDECVGFSVKKQKYFKKNAFKRLTNRYYRVKIILVLFGRIMPFSKKDAKLALDKQLNFAFFGGCDKGNFERKYIPKFLQGGRTNAYYQPAHQKG